VSDNQLFRQNESQDEIKESAADLNESVSMANLVRRASNVINVDLSKLKEMEEIKNKVNKTDRYNAQLKLMIEKLIVQNEKLRAGNLSSPLTPVS